MRAIVIAVALLLAGCGARLEAGNERGGIVDGRGGGASGALAAADQHCRQFGKAAEFVGLASTPGHMIFRCL